MLVLSFECHIGASMQVCLYRFQASDVLEVMVYTAWQLDADLLALSSNALLATSLVEVVLGRVSPALLVPHLFASV